MKKFTCCLTAAACVVGMLAVTAGAVPPTPTEKIQAGAEIRMSRTTDVLLGATLIEGTGFEAIDGWEARDAVNNGFVCGPEFAGCMDPIIALCADPGGNCCIDDPNPDTGWYQSETTMHCTEPHISTANPKSGTQHLRFLRADSQANGHWGVDPGCTGFGSECRTTAFSPLVVGDGPLDVGVTNTDLDISASAAFQGGFRMFEVAESAPGTSIAGYTWFADFGYLYSYEPGVAFHSVGAWTPGEYFHLNLNHNPCDNEFTITTTDGAGAEIASLTYTMDNLAPWVNRVIMIAENKSEPWDIDNFVIVRDGPCPTTCGADGIEAGEHCEIPEAGGDAACPGRCVAPGEVGPDGQAECTCVVEGGMDPCDAITTSDLPNGTTDVISHGGWFSFVADTTATAFETCGSTGFDSYMVVFTNADGSDDCSDETGLDVWITQNDDCDVNSVCCGAGTDPLASCHPVEAAPWESCTCVATVVGQRYWVWEASGGGSIGGNILMTKTKRQTCGAVWDNGACCDGVTAVCTSDVAPGDCVGELDTFTLNKDCGTLTCDPVPGSCCDSAPGLGGACNEGVINADCQDTFQAWSSAACDGSCAEIFGACCDPLDGFCSVTLQGDCTAQHPNGPVWTVDKNCNQVSCDPALGACCNTRFGTCTDNVILADCGGEPLRWTKGDVCSPTTCPDPFIPTVSQWGLVIMTLLLLIGAKVYFGRREALA